MKAFRSLLLGALVLAGAMLVLGLATPAAAQTPVPAYTTVVADAWSDWYWDCGWWDHHWDYDWWWGPSWYHGADWYSGWDWTWTPTPWWYDYLYSYYCHWVWVEIYGTSLVQVPGTNAACTYHITVNFSDGSTQYFIQQGNGGTINLWFSHSATDAVPANATATMDCPSGILETETFANEPADKSRKKIGVGEFVHVRVVPEEPAGVTWSVAGAGRLGENPQPNFCYVIGGERAGSLTVTATKQNGTTLSVTFEIIEPTAMNFIREPNTGIWHIQGTATAGMKLRPHVASSEVSFRAIEVREGTVEAELQGYWTYLANWPARIHPNGRWFEVSDSVVPGFGSKVHAVDESSAKGDVIPYYPGIFTWNIPVYFRVKNGQLGEKQFATVLSVKTMLDDEGTLRIRKGAVEVIVFLDQESSNY